MKERKKGKLELFDSAFTTFILSVFFILLIASSYVFFKTYFHYNIIIQVVYIASYICLYLFFFSTFYEIIKNKYNYDCTYYVIVGLLIAAVILTSTQITTPSKIYLCYTNHSYKLVQDTTLNYLRDNCKITIQIDKDFINSTAVRELFPIIYRSYGD